MAIANSYPMGTPKSGDLLLGTSIPDYGSNEKPSTRNFSISDVTTLATQGYAEVTKVISNAEWIALPTTSIIVVPAVASKRIQVLFAYARFSAADPAYLFSSPLVLSGTAVLDNLNGDNIQASIPQSFQDFDQEVIVFGLEATKPSLSAPIRFGTLSTATNSGSGTVSVTVRYQVI